MKNSTKASLTKIAAMVVSITLALGTGSAAYASETDGGIFGTSAGVNEMNVGVSTICPETTARSTARPSKTWEINKSGQYNFSGYSTAQTLYTNWQFKGKNAYVIRVNNTGSGAITVKAKTLFTTYAQTRVGARKSATLNLSGMNAGTAFYITFDGSYFAFNGYIK